VYHQLRLPATLTDVNSVLEFGPGRGLFGNILKFYGMDYYSADVVQVKGADKPDFLHSINDFPIGNQTFDLVCAFQTLEHNPPSEFLPHLEKMAALSNKYVYVSLPWHGRSFSWNIGINLPKLAKNFMGSVVWPRLVNKKRPHDQYAKDPNPYRFHWFEVGEPGFSKKEIKETAAKAGLKQVQSFHVEGFAYHYFILFEKIDIT